MIVREQRGYGPVSVGGGVMLPPCCTMTVPEPVVPIVLVEAPMLSVDVEAGGMVEPAGGIVVESAGGMALFVFPVDCGVVTVPFG